MCTRAHIHLVNRLELLSDGKDGLDVVVAQFLNQMGNGGVVLQKQHFTMKSRPTGVRNDGGQDGGHTK